MRFPPPQHGSFIAFMPPSPNHSPKLSPGLGGAPCPLPLRAHSILASHHFTCSFPNSNKVNTSYLYHPSQIVCQIRAARLGLYYFSCLLLLLLLFSLAINSYNLTISFSPVLTL